MKLKVQDAVFDIEDIVKTTIGPDDVIIIRVDLNLNTAQRTQFVEALKAGVATAFPNNKVLVMDKSVTISIATITQ
jgi:hypothetical protein